METGGDWVQSQELVRVKEEHAEPPPPSGAAHEPLPPSGAAHEPLVHIKEEIEKTERCDNSLALKDEISCPDSAGCGVSEEAKLAGLYTDHEVKDEFVLGPEHTHRPDVDLVVLSWAIADEDGSILTVQESHRPEHPLRDCCVRLERVPHIEALVQQQTDTREDTNTDTDTNSNAEDDILSKIECEKTLCALCGLSFSLKSDLLEHIMIHIYNPSTEQEESVYGLADSGGSRHDPATKRTHALLDCFVKLKRLAHVETLLVNKKHTTKNIIKMNNADYNTNASANTAQAEKTVGEETLNGENRQGTPDVQLQLGGLSLREEEKLLLTPPKEGTDREDTQRGQPFYKYESKAAKRKAKLARKKAALAAAGSGTTKEANFGGATAGPSYRAAKIKRQSTDEGSHSERPPAKRLNRGTRAAEGPRDIAKANRGLAVVVCREDGAPVDEALARLIRKKLVQLIEVVVMRGVMGETDVVEPVFATSGLVSEGFFLVTPRTAETRDWTLSQDFGVLDGHRVVVRKLEQTRVQVWIPGEPDTEKVREFLHHQNRDLRQGLRFLEWKASGTEILGQGTRLTFMVPEGVEEQWGEEKVKTLNFAATSIRARILRANTDSKPEDQMQGDTAPAWEREEPVDNHTAETDGMEVADGELSK